MRTILKTSIMLLAMMFISLSVSAYDFMAGGLCYIINSDGSSVTVTSQKTSSPRYSSLNGPLAIPSSVFHSGKTYTVSAVDDGAFQGCSGITALTIPVSLTSIGEGAFAGCTGITVVNWNAKSCQDLNPYEYEEGNWGPAWDEYIIMAFFTDEKLPFYDLTNIKSIVFGNTVERIPAHICHGLTGLTSVNIPSSVIAVGDSAFTKCSGLTSVTFSNSVAVGNDAFRSCGKISRVNITDLEAWCKMDFKTAYSNPLFYAHHLYINGAKFTNLVLPNNVTSVGDYTFENCDDLNSLSLHDKITSIGDSAFINCTGLTGELNIPQSLLGLGHSAFSNCSGLTALNWNAKSCDFSIDEWVQAGHTSSGGYYNNRRELHPFYNTHFNHVEFGDEVEFIPVFLCLDFSSISSVTIPEKVTGIGLCAFMGCTSLTSVQWNAIACERDLDLDDDYWLENPLWLDDSDVSQPDVIFGLSSINSFIFGDKVTQIPSLLCYDLAGLSAITIPSTVNYIGTEAFAYCTGLESIYSFVDPSKVTLGEDVFYCVSKDGVLHVLPQYLSTYQQAEQWKEFFNIVDDLETERPPIVCGDENGDGIVDVADVNIMIDMVLGKREQDIALADLNDDGIVDVSDVSAIIDLVLGKTEMFSVNGVKFNMAPVQGGTFTMGATQEQGSMAKDDEKPAHRVTVSGFSIGVTEVTQELWQAVMGNNPSKFRSANGYQENLKRPVETVTREEALTFISRLNALTGQTFRLPTEAEWEFAARGGTKSKGTMYAGSNDPDQVAWCAINSGKVTHAVGTKAPNELGLYDMSGNVYEWCSDYYGGYSSESQTNPTGPATGEKVVVRGASWYHAIKDCRVSARLSINPAKAYDSLGIRLAK